VSRGSSSYSTVVPKAPPDGARAVHEEPAVTTFLFTDIEGSTRLWDEQPEAMRPALARHDALARAVVERHRGALVKTTGDGIHAVFTDPLDAVRAVVDLQQAVGDPVATAGLSLRVRCGIHAGVVEHRDADYFGTAVNRAARIMSAAHGGQMLISQSVADLVEGRLPAAMTLRDLGAVRLRDLARPERIYQIVHPGMPAEFPPLRSLEGTPNNLPLQATSFIGRKRELADVRRLLQTTRLLTLLGMGGLGKSRLSLQIAADVLDAYPDGAWLVELAPITDAERVLHAVAAVLGIKEDAGRPMQEAVLKHVHARRLLIILDNCEHLIAACAECAKALLQFAPDVTILATSREPLRISGETTLQIPPLAGPPDAHPAASALHEHDATRLFIERAAAAQPGFQASERNAAAIADICRRLDGLPLAIELAAARVRVMPVERIAERLGDRFRLLVSGERAALPRQQTLRAVVDWSYELLDVPERAIFRRLSVFAGGFTLEAAEAIVADALVGEGDVMDLVSRLVDKSLVERDAEGDRYRLLETVREYANERLAQSDDERAVRARHLAYYVAFAEHAGDGLIGSDQGTWLARLDAERENVFAAHRQCGDRQDAAMLGTRLVSALRRYWFIRGLLGLGYRMTLEALARPALQPPTPLRCRMLHDAGQTAAYMGHYGDARRYLEESLAIARTLGDEERIAEVLQPLGLACAGLADIAAARGHFEEALARARKLDNSREVAAALNALAQVARMDGDLASAAPLYEQVLALARKMQDRYVISISLLNLAMVAVGGDAGSGAAAILLEAMDLAAETSSKPALQSALEVSCSLAASRGEWQQAARFFGAAETQTAATGIHRDPADDAFLAAWVAKARGALDASSYAAAEAGGRALGFEEAIAEARRWLAGPR
jgi:predicted ATPase/class 3 adenylate cyclase